MARARNIKPALFKNELLGVEDPMLTILFISLWCLADKAGRLEDRPLRIRAETFPYRENIDINRYLTVLTRLGFIRRYEVDGSKIIQVINFNKHQHPHKTEAESVLPEYDEKSDGCSITVKAPLSNGSRPADSLIPDSLIPDSLIPDSLIPDCGNSVSKETSLPLSDGVENQPRPAPKIQSIKKSENKDLSPSHETWEAYSDAYERRYKAKPVRNATVNGQISSFIKRIGFDEAPMVAAFYVYHNNSFYVQKMHTVGLLLADAEKLRTEWATNRQVTNTQARQADKTQARGNVFNKLIEEAKANATN